MSAGDGMRLRLGTRGSALAVAQSGQVAQALRALGHQVELVRIRTGGDTERGSLTRLGSLGVFAAELRRALLDGEVDLAVHSFKDLPTMPVPGLVVAAVPPRAEARDALCAPLPLADLPAGASIGTGSPRRVAQLRRLRPDLSFVDVRGNVGTRLARVAEGDLAGVVLAAAGLERLGLSDRIVELLDILPAPAQGALAVECRGDRGDVVAAIAALDDPESHLAAEAERGVLAALGGGCAAPIAAWARDGRLTAGVFDTDGTKELVVSRALEPRAAAQAAAELLRLGAEQITELGAARESRLAELHDDTSLWAGTVVLAGTRVLLPRPDGDLADAIRAAGAEVVAEPLTRRVRLPIQNLRPADWVVVTSPVTVEVLADAGLELPDGARIAAVGRGTAAALAASGRTVDLVPTGRAGAAALLEVFPPGDETVLIPGSALSSPELAEGLRALGHPVQSVALYTTEPVDQAPPGLVEDYRSGAFDVVALTSGSIARAVDALLGWPDGVRVVAFGEPTRAALQELGVEIDATATTQDGRGLVQAIAASERSS